MRGQCEVGDRQHSGHVLAIAERAIQDGGGGGELRAAGGDQRRVGRAEPERLLHHPLVSDLAHRRSEVRDLPGQPAIDLGGGAPRGR